jgi:uncharacterized protein (TIGR00106 family)
LIMAEVSIVPLGEGTSVRRYVKAAIQSLQASGLNILVGPMSTTVEARTLQELNLAISSAHEAVFKLGAKRVVTTLKIDDRRDKKASMKSNLAAVE